MTNAGILAAGEVGRRQAAKIARRWQLRRIVGRTGHGQHVLECGHTLAIPIGLIEPLEPRASRRCHQCPQWSYVCRCTTRRQQPHWKDEHGPRCRQCSCSTFHAVRRDLR